MYTVLNDRPLNPIMLVILGTLERIVSSHGGGHFVIGATARDILMTHVFGIEAGRATRDVDLAIALKDWKQFEAIKNEFINSGDYQAAAGQGHRLYYRQDEYGTAYPLDLIPFGEIEQPGNMIAWPPDMAVVMNVAGYAEAHRTAIKVQLGKDVVANVISIPALASLKLLAWNERGLEDNKDAADFYFLLKNYYRAGNEARLYDEAHSILEANEYDLELAGATLLGYDTSLILEKATHRAVLGILADSVSRDRLLIHMDRSIGSNSSVIQDVVGQFERGLKLSSL